MGVRGKVEQPVDNQTAISSFRHRGASNGGRSRSPRSDHSPRRRIPYDADLDRFFLDLPLNGVRSPHSLRAYGYDIAVWVRFLHAACGETVWAATRADVDAFHRSRRREDAGARISAASWNRSVAALEKLYRWAELEGLIKSGPSPIAISGGGDMAPAGPHCCAEQLYERAAKRSDVRFVSLEDYRVFRDSDFAASTSMGPSGPAPETATGRATHSSPSCWSQPACAFPEASFLLAHELANLGRHVARGRQTRFELPSALTKGERSRSILLPHRGSATDLGLYRRRASSCGHQVPRPRGLARDRAAHLHSPTRAACDRAEGSLMAV